MQVVYRYPVIPGRNLIFLPEKAQPVFFGYQSGRREFSLWALIEENEPIEAHGRVFYFVGTGQAPATSAELSYIGSVVTEDGFHVFHLLEARDRSHVAR